MPLPCLCAAVCVCVYAQGHLYGRIWSFSLRVMRSVMHTLTSTHPRKKTEVGTVGVAGREGGGVGGGREGWRDGESQGESQRERAREMNRMTAKARGARNDTRDE